MSLNQQFTDRSLVLVGLMGAGKSTVGRRLAARIGLEFLDSDSEIEAAAGSTISNMFADFGETYFRDGERKVIKRLLDGPPIVLATGGGAFMSSEIRQIVAQRSVSIWLRADLDTLWDRVKGKPGRPLLETLNPKQTLAGLIAQRHPTYGLADVIIDSAPEQPHDAVVDAIVTALKEI